MAAAANGPVRSAGQFLPNAAQQRVLDKYYGGKITEEHDYHSDGEEEEEGGESEGEGEESEGEGEESEGEGGESEGGE